MSDPLNTAFVFPTAEIAASFAGMADIVKDLREPLAESAEDFEDNMEKQFQSEGMGSSHWDGLSPITQEIRSQEGDPPQHPIMDRTGALKKSFTKKGAAGHVREIKKLSMVIGSNLKVRWRGKSWVLAWIQSEKWTQVTTDRQEPFFAWKWGIHIKAQETIMRHPKRQILFIAPSTLRRMETRLQHFILKKAGKNFAGLIDPVHIRQQV